MLATNLASDNDALPGLSPTPLAADGSHVTESRESGESAESACRRSRFVELQGTPAS